LSSAQLEGLGRSRDGSKNLPLPRPPAFRSMRIGRSGDLHSSTTSHFPQQGASRTDTTHGESPRVLSRPGSFFSFRTAPFLVVLAWTYSEDFSYDRVFAPLRAFSGFFMLNVNWILMSF